MKCFSLLSAPHCGHNCNVLEPNPGSAVLLAAAFSMYHGLKVGHYELVREPYLLADLRKFVSWLPHLVKTSSHSMVQR